MHHQARYIALAAIMAFPMDMTLLAQGTLLPGIVLDKESGHGVEGVHIIRRAGEQGTVTDEEGRFALDIPGNRSVELVVRHVSYVGVDTVVRPGDGVFELRLRRRVIELPDVQVRPSGPEIVFRPVVRHVADHVPTREGIWVLAYDHSRFVTRVEDMDRKPLRDVCLHLLDACMQDRASIVLPGEVVRLHPARDGGVHVEGMDIAYHVRYRHGGPDVRPFPLDSLFRAVLPWTDSLSGRLVGNDRVPDFPAFDHLLMDPRTGERQVVCSVEDAHTMALFRSQYKYMSGPDKVVAMRLGEELGVDKEVVAGYMTGFPADIYFHCPEAPLFVVHDTLCVFDRDAGLLRRFASDGRGLGIAPLAACEPRGWDVHYLQDAMSGGVYVLSSRNGRNVVRAVDVATGLPGAPTEVPQRFATKLKVRDGQLYFLHRTPGSDEHMMLYRLRLR
ncbi:MAG: carboxypeptidase-like regulatory domain-containing protein [Flavobacteriales bacterium]|nr:carboxypeptidase-like regulatory domain-containing protein [Flavobacteriales bacterium]MCB9168015.1 carboxypeptidase-like regulatory domain-containing protein [Flavobacteriales bacterium]